MSDGSRPRVLHLVPALFGAGGVIGGGERYVFELARHMAAVTPTTLLSFGGADEIRREGPLTIRVLGEPWLVRRQRSNPFSPRILSSVRECDVVHCHQQHILVSSFAAAVARATGRRVVCTDLGGGGWDVSAYVNTDRWYHAHLHLSEYSRRIAGHERSPRASVIYGGVDAARFCPGPRHVVGKEALFVGRILPHKGLDDFVDALGIETPGVILGPVPDAAYLARLRERARGRPVEFRHGCSDDDLVTSYRRAACVVLPSVYRDRDGRHTEVPELLGQTLLEGMACGRPAICTAVASLPEIVEHGVTGLVVPPNDPVALGAALRWIAMHPAEALRMGEAGRRRVLERFTWEAVVRRCLDRYDGRVGRLAA
jgi:glycosyltransferase involved in cell wall biosynthesis